MFGLNKDNFPIGLDISDSFIKAVQLQKKGDRVRLTAHSRMPLPPGAIIDGEIMDKTKISQAIIETLKNPAIGKFTSDEAIISLPEVKSFIKLIWVERTSNAIENQISSEIEKHIPFSTNEISYDWQAINNLSLKKEGQVPVLISAAPISILDRYTETIENAGLTVSAMEIESISISRSILMEESKKYKGPLNKNYCLIDIGGKRTSLLVYAGNTILFTISLPISGQEITDQIMRSLELTEKEAEKAKIVCGLDEDKAQGVIKNILSDTIQKLNNKIKESLEFYDNHYSEFGPINLILLCGGGANIKKIDTLIKEASDIEVRIADPLINFGGAGEADYKDFIETHDLSLDNKTKSSQDNFTITQDSSLSYAAAIGLALRGLFTD